MFTSFFNLHSDLDVHLMTHKIKQSHGEYINSMLRLCRIICAKVQVSQNHDD